MISTTEEAHSWMRRLLILAVAEGKASIAGARASLLRKGYCNGHMAMEKREPMKLISGMQTWKIIGSFPRLTPG